MRMLLVRMLSISAALCVAGTAHADVVTDWNATAVTAVQALGPGTPVQSRALAIVHLAMFDALNAIDRRYQSYAEPLQAPPGFAGGRRGRRHHNSLWMIPLRNRSRCRLTGR
jgi:hypothetical protein